MLKWILIGIITVIASIFIYGVIKNRIIRNKQVRIFRSIFTENFICLPTIEFGFVYSWPTIKIVFKSKSDFDKAKEVGLTSKFENEIQNIYGDDFDSSKAISYEVGKNDL